MNGKKKKKKIARKGDLFLEAGMLGAEVFAYLLLSKEEKKSRP